MSARQDRLNRRQAEAASKKKDRLRVKINELLVELERAAVDEYLAWERVYSDEGLGR